jgi:hypothetical protein
LTESRELAEIAKKIISDKGFVVGEIQETTNANKDKFNASIFPILMDYPSKDSVDPESAHLLVNVTFTNSNDFNSFKDAALYVQTQVFAALQQLELALITYRDNLPEHKWPAAEKLHEQFKVLMADKKETE